MGSCYSNSEDVPVRGRDEACAMAIVLQANLVQLKVADARRRDLPVVEHEIRAPSPGAVSQFREHLIDRHVISEYDANSLALRMHEVWGHHCLFRWAFHCTAEDSNDLSQLTDDDEFRCDTVLRAKAEELNAILWKTSVSDKL